MRDELIQAAMQILDRAPATKLSLRMIAKEAGVSPTSVYPHFKDAKTLEIEVIRECWTQLGLEMERAAEQIPADQPGPKLKAQVSSYINYAMERPSRYHLLFAIEPIDLGAKQLAGMLQPASRNISDTLDEFVSIGGKIPADNVFNATVLTMSLVHGRVAIAHLAPTRPGNKKEKVIEFILDSLDHLFFIEKDTQ